MLIESAVLAVCGGRPPASRSRSCLSRAGAHRFRRPAAPGHDRTRLERVGFALLLTTVTSRSLRCCPHGGPLASTSSRRSRTDRRHPRPGARRQRLRGALVVAEVALAVILLTGAGLMLRSLWNLQRINLGFNPDRVLTMRLALPAAQYDTPAKVIEFYDRLLQDVRATAGVESAGLLRLLPLATSIGDWGLTIEGYTPPPGVSTPGDWQVATAGGPESLGERSSRADGSRRPIARARGRRAHQ
jgi:hypothetical protein